jgi:hypothetical protein
MTMESSNKTHDFNGDFPMDFPMFVYQFFLLFISSAKRQNILGEAVLLMATQFQRLGPLLVEGVSIVDLPREHGHCLGKTMINHWKMMTNQWKMMTNYRNMMINHWKMITNHWKIMTNYWNRMINHWNTGK